MTIRSILIPALQSRFPEVSFVAGEPPSPIARYPARHPEVGDLCIFDHGDEVTVAIGTITHTHFSAHDPGLDPSDTEAWISEQVLEFISELFADRIVVWCVPGHAGGHHPVDHPRRPIPPHAKVCTWSGPLAAATPC